jgi:hypothetical protein
VVFHCVKKKNADAFKIFLFLDILAFAGIADALSLIINKSSGHKKCQDQGEMKTDFSCSFPEVHNRKSGI